MEKWKPIKMEPIYSVSTKGQVKNNLTDHIKSLRLDRYGYQRVTLYPSAKTYTIHGLVMKTFTPESEWKEQVNHKDLIKTNNDIKNLEWNTPLENIRHYHKHGIIPNRKGEKSPRSKLTQNQVEEIIIRLHKKQSMPFLSKTYNVSLTTIERIKYGECW